MQKLQPGDIVTFTEYEVSQLSGRKRVRQRMENMIVEAVIYPGEALSAERISEYYGDGLTDQERLALSVSHSARLVLMDDEQNTYCVNTVNDFLKSGLQVIEVGARTAPQSAADAPSYLQFLNMLGGQGELSNG